MLSVQRDNPMIGQVYDMLNMVWKTYHFSPKSMRELKALGEDLGVNVLVPSGVRGTRWLPHVSRALDTLLRPGKDDHGQSTAIWTTWQGLLPMQILQGEPERSVLFKEFLIFLILCFHYQFDFFELSLCIYCACKYGKSGFRSRKLRRTAHLLHSATSLPMSFLDSQSSVSSSREIKPYFLKYVIHKNK